jgi:hypothetical protein
VETIMVARDVEQAAAALRALRHEEWGRTGLVVLFFALAVAASAMLPSLAVPLLVGGLTAVVLAIRVFWRRWDLLDRLLLERDAYTIAEVRHRAEQVATLRSRGAMASAIRRLLTAPGIETPSWVVVAAEDLQALAEELEDDDLSFDPVCAVLCARLVAGSGSNHTLSGVGQSPQDVTARVRRIRAGLVLQQPPGLAHARPDAEAAILAKKSRTEMRPRAVHTARRAAGSERRLPHA